MLAVSNIAWSAAEDAAVARLFAAFGVSGVEIAPTKCWDAPLEARAADIAAYRRWWNDRGVQIVATQALLFGRPDLQLFGDAESRAAMFEHLTGMIELSARLGARAAVFGSPRNRLVGTTDAAQARGVAVDFFLRLGRVARAHDVAVCFEANPPLYGCDFVLTTTEAVALVDVVDDPGFRVQIDAGTMTANEEPYLDTLTRAVPRAGHFHISEPGLVEVGSVATDHRAIDAALQQTGYRGWVSIEMRAATDGRPLDSLERTLAFVRSTYHSVAQHA